ncbi:alpha/beta fold hydrolase [Amycolatopsis thermoflava]|uniref:alpha/beta fold hydrolase n=1 Tax=Amycolatopsis thermoflava TaxID=84480 RepID=UPI003D73CA5F
MPVALSRVRTNGIETTVATAGSGPAVLLLHGFPHTWQLWREVLPTLTRTHRVIAPDQRWTGSDATGGYDAGTLAADALGILDALGEPSATVVGIDAGTPSAALLALRHPGRVRRLVVMESLLGTLPGGEDFLAAGPPWWFGFHAVPGLAEEVLAGHEAAYLDFFLAAGTRGRASRPASGTPSSPPTPAPPPCAAPFPSTGSCRAPPGSSRRRCASAA